MAQWLSMVLQSERLGDQNQGSNRPGKVLEFDFSPGKLLEFENSAFCPGIL